MWVKYLKKIDNHEKGDVVHCADNRGVQKAYEDGEVVPLLGPEGPSIHAAAPEDVLALWGNIDRSKHEKYKTSIKKYRAKKDR
jgi:hypothetical protein